VLLVTDLHAGPFLRPEALAPIVDALVPLAPDLVVFGGDAVTGTIDDLETVLPLVERLAQAPLGAWFCRGNHEYFTGDPPAVEARLATAGVRSLVNDSVRLSHGGVPIVVAGIDDLLLGRPDWVAVLTRHGVPDVLLAHNPDHFYDAERRGVPLVLSGHTHGGQVRLPGWGPIVRHSRFCLDEGLYQFGESLLVVSRGLGVSALPWRAGALPEVVLVTIRSGRREPPGSGRPTTR
jgi:predicted MPP superfamily phosphohydrolase